MINLLGKNISSIENIIDISAEISSDLKSHGINVYDFAEATIDCFNSLINYNGLCTNKLSRSHNKMISYNTRSDSFYFYMICNCPIYNNTNNYRLITNSIGYTYRNHFSKTYTKADTVFHTQDFYIINLYNKNETILFLYDSKEPIKVIDLIDEDATSIFSNPIILNLKSKIDILM